MSKIFNINQSAKVKTSAFDLSHERKLSAKMGELVPVLLQEVVPGDRFSIDTQSMIRLAPLVSPMMHRVNAYIHYFYVPSRILWPDWEKFITGESANVVPLLRLADHTIPEGGILDHLGIPPGTYPTTNYAISALPLRAYLKIWNDYYRDENLQIEIELDTDVDFISSKCFNRAWEKDYFTSALPWAQKGNPVTMDAKINYRDETLAFDAGTENPASVSSTIGTNAAIVDGKLGINDGSGGIMLDNIESVEIEVEELRRATRLQRWLERNARSGSRYVEHLLSHWGIKSSDQRLQRAEYIGGGKSPIVIGEVLNTTGTEDLPQGNMAGHGISVGRTNKGNKFCEEHGYIIGIMSILPEPTYQQGIHKTFMRHLNLDYYYPEFAQLGEQPVLNSELFFQDGDDTVNSETFGYQSRFAEMKYAQSSVHGAFRSTLDFWHMGRKFATLPGLTSEFIKCTPDNRVFAVTDPNVENLYIQLYHKITAIRPLPFFNNPTL